MEKSRRNTCGNTAEENKSPIRELEIWVRGMNKQGDLSRKVAQATELALTLWWAMTDEQRADLVKRDSIRHAVTNLIGHGFSWCV